MEKPNLDELYNPPAEMIRQATLDHLEDFHEAYLKVATFFCLATGSDAGLDASPRGGPPGFVRVLDPLTIAFADWPGNNRIDSMRNLEQNDRIGMLFLFPGLEIFMRINGRGRVTVEREILERVADSHKVPKAAIVVSIDQVFFHCGKAINRSGIWRQETHLNRRALPSPGEIIARITKLSKEQAAQLDSHYDRSVREDLY